MARLLLLNAVIFLGVVIIILEAAPTLSRGCDYQFCSYTGDPHLIPFYQSSIYLCDRTGWELLLSNQYVTIYVKTERRAPWPPAVIVDVSNEIQNVSGSVLSLN